jgi:N utilization substance protein A
VVVQKFREAEREMLYNEFIKKEHEIITGIVQRRDRRNVVIQLGRMDAVLPPAEQLPRESYNFQDRIKVYVTEVKQSSKGPMVNVSRAHPDLVKKLFEQEVPEVYDGIVEIKSVAREPGSRTKISVYSSNPNVDPIGSCVGQNGYRVKIISQELRG